MNLVGTENITCCIDLETDSSSILHVAAFSDDTLDSLTKFVEDSFEAFRSGGSIFPACTEGSEQLNSNVKLFCELKRSANSLNEQFSFSK